MTEIAEAEWRTFSECFSREHDGWAATLQIRRAGGGEELAVEDRPFRGLTVEQHRGGGEMILMFGDDPDEHLAHIVEEPRALAVLDPEAERCSLIIGLADGGGCILELSNPRSPD